MSNTPPRKHRRPEKQPEKQVPVSDFDIAVKAMNQARDNFALAMSLLSDTREKTHAILYFDTALLWSSEAFKVAQVQEQQNKKRRDHLARQFRDFSPTTEQEEIDAMQLRAETAAMQVKTDPTNGAE